MGKPMLRDFLGILEMLQKSLVPYDPKLCEIDFSRMPDETDMASQKEMEAKEARRAAMANACTRSIDRAFAKITGALAKTSGGGDYGYCEECDCEIGVPRLEVQPYAELCISCKQEREVVERQYV